MKLSLNLNAKVLEGCKLRFVHQQLSLIDSSFLPLLCQLMLPIYILLYNCKLKVEFVFQFMKFKMRDVSKCQNVSSDQVVWQSASDQMEKKVTVTVVAAVCHQHHWRKAGPRGGEMIQLWFVFSVLFKTSFEKLESPVLY